MAVGVHPAYVGGVSRLADHSKALLTLLHSGDLDNVDQAVELLAALEAPGDALEALAGPLLRSSYTSRKLAGMRLVGRFHDQLDPALLARARQIISRKLAGRSRTPIRRGLAMLAALDHADSTVSLWRDLMSGQRRRLSSTYRTWILHSLTQLIPDDAVLDTVTASYRDLFGDDMLSAAEPPAPLLRMPRLAELSFDGCRRIMPAWLPALTTLRRLNLRDAPTGTLQTEALPPSLCTLRLHGASVQAVRLSLPTLRSLELSRCAALETLDLSGCTALETLNLSGCTALTTLPPSISALPALRSLDVSGCSRLEALPRALRRADLEITSRGCVSLRRSPPSLQAPEPDAAPAQRRAALGAIRRQLRSRQVPDVRDAIAALDTLAPADQAPLREVLEAALLRWLSYRDPIRVEIGLSLAAAAETPSLLAALWGESLFTRDAVLGGAPAAAHASNAARVTSTLLARLPAESRQQVRGLRSRQLANLSLLPELVGLQALVLEEISWPALPDLSALERLESLTLRRCWYLESLPETLAALPALRELVLDRLPRLQHQSVSVIHALEARGARVEIVDRGTRWRVHRQ